MIEILFFLLDVFHIFSVYLFLDQDFRIGTFESSFSNFCRVWMCPVYKLTEIPAACPSSLSSFSGTYSILFILVLSTLSGTEYIADKMWNELN